MWSPARLRAPPDAAEVVAIEKIGLASLSDGEDQLPSAVRAYGIERDRRGPAEVEVATIEVAPIRGGEIVAAFDRWREVGREAQDGFAVAPLSCAEPAGCAEVLPVTAKSDCPSPLTPPCAHMPPPRARREARDLARVINGNADNKAIGAAIAPVSAEGKEDLALEQRQRATLVLH